MPAEYLVTQTSNAQAPLNTLAAFNKNVTLVLTKQ